MAVIIILEYIALSPQGRGRRTIGEPARSCEDTLSPLDGQVTLTTEDGKAHERTSQEHTQLADLTRPNIRTASSLGSLEANRSLAET